MSLNPMLVPRAEIQTRIFDFDVTAGESNIGELRLFSVIGAATAPGTGRVLATAVMDTPEFTLPTLAEFIRTHLGRLVSLQITGASNGDVVSGLAVRAKRFDPDTGSNEEKKITAPGYQDTKDFQSTRLNFPINELLDGYTQICIINPNPGLTPFRYHLMAVVEGMFDRRNSIPMSSAKRILSPANS